MGMSSNTEHDQLKKLYDHCQEMRKNINKIVSLKTFMNSLF